MEIEKFALWQKRQGNKVIQTESSLWYEAGPHVFQAFPYDWVITPTEKELHDLLVKNKIAAVRFSTPVESQLGKISYHIIKKPPYSIDCLKNKSKKNIYLGLSKCKVEEISLAQLAKEGWALQLNTLERQNRTDSMDKAKWENICLSAEDIPGFSAWGAYVDGEMAASLLTACIDGTAYFLYSLSHEKFMDLRVNHVIFFEVTQRLLQKEGIQKAFFTVQSLDAPKSVDDFKFRIGFEPISVRQRVVFHPLLAPFITPFSHKLVLLLLQISKKKNFLAKMEGIMRFYLEGKRPLSQQKYPDCLLETQNNCY
jgi:hypothetical protein